MGVTGSQRMKGSLYPSGVCMEWNGQGGVGPTDWGMGLACLPTSSSLLLFVSWESVLAERRGLISSFFYGSHALSPSGNLPLMVSKMFYVMFFNLCFHIGFDFSHGCHIFLCI